MMQKRVQPKQSHLHNDRTRVIQPRSKHAVSTFYLLLAAAQREEKLKKIERGGAA
jgi:hypothetical protein